MINQRPTIPFGEAERAMSTATISSAPGPLLTAEQFGQREDPGHPEELVRGRVVAMPIADRRYGQICGNTIFVFGSFLDAYDLGHLLCISGVITERDPDTVRGADVAYYSFARLPRGPLPKAYGPEVPELVVEVFSKSDRWVQVLAKVVEYLDAGVDRVLVLDDDRQSAQIYQADGETRVLGPDDTLSLPDILPGFSVVVRRFFE